MMKLKMLSQIALLSALTLACNKDKEAESPDDGAMEDAGETMDEAAEDTEESFEEAGEEIEDAVDETGDELDGDPTTD